MKNVHVITVIGLGEFFLDPSTGKFMIIIVCGGVVMRPIETKIWRSHVVL